MFDAAIVGAGPAGLSAAINLKQLGKDFIWFGSAGGGKVAKSELIANYPGLGLISGGEMDRRFAEHAAALGIAPEDKLVTGIMPLDGKYMLLAENQVYEARAVILATGAVAAKGLPGEQEYLGRGVSYCATCDGFLYRGKRIAVLCASPRYEHEAAYLAQLAEETFFWPAYPASALGGGGLTRLSGPIAQDPAAGQGHRHSPGGRHGDRCGRGVLPAQRRGPGRAAARPAHGRAPHRRGPAVPHQPGGMLCRRGLHRPALSDRQGGGGGQRGRPRPGGVSGGRR